MTKILFVCHGNICRSPMAEFYMKDLAERAGLAGEFEILSAATSSEELGNGVYPPVRALLEQRGIDCAGKTVRLLRASDYEDFMKGKITIIGCPKLDAVDYSEKLTAIIRDNDIKSVTIVRMEVPCCGGLQREAETALRNSGKFIPWQVVTISRDGKILE